MSVRTAQPAERLWTFCEVYDGTIFGALIEEHLGDLVAHVVAVYVEPAIAPFSHTVPPPDQRPRLLA